MVTAHQASGLSHAAYARQIGVAAHRISHRYGRLCELGEGERTSADGFVPVRVVDEESARAAARKRPLEVVVLEDGRMSITGDWASVRGRVRVVESSS
jgi:hypothetical protein